jgi:osmotically-inducible protein OsmY
MANQNQWEGRNRGDFRSERGYRDRDRSDRGLMDRAVDEVRSWAGDDEASRRRRMDELRDSRRDRDWSDAAARSGERAFERTRDTMREATDWDRDGRRGMAEWRDDDRMWDRTRDDRSVWNRERSFGDTRRYANADPYPATSWSMPTYGMSPDVPRTGYAGRGPRGYQRTDARIREDVCDYLTDDPRIDASDVEVQVNGGEVTLAGSVRTREQKRITEDVAEQITGVREVNNNLKVRPADEVLGTARSGAAPLGLTDTPPPPATATKHR